MDHDTLATLDFNFLDASRLFVAFADRGEYLERKDVAIACCGLPAEALNWGFLKPPYADPEATAAAVRGYFADRRLPFQLMYRASDPHRWRAQLESGGWFRKIDPLPGMALAIPAANPAPVPHLAIVEVRTREQLAAFRETAFRGFGYPVAAARMFLGNWLLAAPGVRLYSGLVDGALVATSMTVATGAIAGIYWVATLEEQRGKGYGAALTWAAVRGGGEAGCRIASLQASKLGRPVYARMGFEHVLDYEHLSPPES